MTPIELRDIVARLFPNKRQDDLAAELLNIEGRTLRRWLKGDAQIDGCATVLLRLLRGGRITLADVRAAYAQRPGLSP
jgi:hypothetical protein